MVINLYLFANALQMWPCIEPNLLGEPCPHAMCTKEAACKSAGATLPLCAADMDYIQAVYRIILEQVSRCCVAVYNLY